MIGLALFGAIYKPVMLNEPIDFSGPASPASDATSCFTVTKTCETDVDCAACSASTGVEFNCIDEVCTTNLSPAALECNYDHGGRLVMSGDTFTESTNYNCTCTWPMWIGPGCNDLNPAICQIVWQPDLDKNEWYQASGFDLDAFETAVENLKNPTITSPNGTVSPAAIDVSTEYIDALYDACSCIPPAPSPVSTSIANGMPITNIYEGPEGSQVPLTTKIRGSFGWPICSSLQFPQNNCDQTGVNSTYCNYYMQVPNTTWYMTSWDPISSSSSPNGEDDSQYYLTEAQDNIRTGFGWIECGCKYPVTGEPDLCWTTKDAFDKYDRGDVVSPSGEDQEGTNFQFVASLCTNNGKPMPKDTCISTLEYDAGPAGEESPCKVIESS
jgi:hypothetical protein